MEVDRNDTRVSKMAKCHIWITSASRPATALYQRNTRKDVAGYLATLTHHHKLQTHALGWFVKRHRSIRT